jgi:23S rRNA pseudouridine1911/1915/1917 synthase
MSNKVTKKSVKSTKSAKTTKKAVKKAVIVRKASKVAKIPKGPKLPTVTVLYEDKDLIVVDKPAGLMVHPDGRDAGPFLTDWVLANYPKTAKVGEPTRALDGTTILRPGIVHRLDRETSGALIIAKTAAAHAHLKKQFQDRTVVKKYLAFVWGDMGEEFGTITRSIGRNTSDFRKWSAQRGARGELRLAETYWSSVARVDVSLEVAGMTEKFDQEKSEKFTLIEVEPKTGRTHQIRVHLVSIHHPVVGDSLYAPKRPTALGFERTALHARSVQFIDLAGKMVKVVAPLPKDFKAACKVLGIEEKVR